VRFLVDECTGPAVARWLRAQRHDVFSVYEEARGIDDDEVIQRAFAEHRVLISNDKDFGEKIYRERLPHEGVILLRLADERSAVKIEVLRKLLSAYSHRIPGQFVVVTETKVRFARIYPAFEM
jgi:predicted nuclease of predicted toxin-antitoxin system